MASASEFRRYLAESGQQSRLDAIQREPGGFEKALAEYNRGGGQFAQPSVQAFDFGASQRAAEELLRKQQEQQGQFLGRFKTEVPAALGAIEQELGLPQLRETAFTQGELVRLAPERVTAGAKGYDVNQNQLERMIAADVAKLAPGAQTAYQQAQFGEAELGRRAERAIMPYEIEAGFLGENVKNQVQLFRDNVKSQLDTALTQMQIQGQFDLQGLQNAARLAEMERAVDLAQMQGTFADLGDRIALIDPETGQEIQSFSKGLAPKRGAATTAGGAGLQSLFDQYFG